MLPQSWHRHESRLRIRSLNCSESVESACECRRILLLDLSCEVLSLFSRHKSVGTKYSRKQHLRVSSRSMRARQKIGTDHLQAIASRFVRAKHQRRRFDCLFDDWNLALVELEINNVRWL